jgi:hypothetical protein
VDEPFQSSNAVAGGGPTRVSRQRVVCGGREIRRPRLSLDKARPNLTERHICIHRASEAKQDRTPCSALTRQPIKYSVHEGGLVDWATDILHIFGEVAGTVAVSRDRLPGAWQEGAQLLLKDWCLGALIVQELLLESIPAPPARFDADESPAQLRPKQTDDLLLSTAVELGPFTSRLGHKNLSHQLLCWLHQGNVGSGRAGNDTINFGVAPITEIGKDVIRPQSIITNVIQRFNAWSILGHDYYH